MVLESLDLQTALFAELALLAPDGFGLDLEVSVLQKYLDFKQQLFGLLRHLPHSLLRLALHRLWDPLHHMH